MRGIKAPLPSCTSSFLTCGKLCLDRFNFLKTLLYFFNLFLQSGAIFMFPFKIFKIISKITCKLSPAQLFNIDFLNLGLA